VCLCSHLQCILYHISFGVHLVSWNHQHCLTCVSWLQQAGYPLQCNPYLAGNCVLLCATTASPVHSSHPLRANAHTPFVSSLATMCLCCLLCSMRTHPADCDLFWSQPPTPPLVLSEGKEVESPVVGDLFRGCHNPLRLLWSSRRGRKLSLLL
jgi:hypothetical protein